MIAPQRAFLHVAGSGAGAPPAPSDAEASTAPKPRFAVVPARAPPPTPEPEARTLRSVAAGPRRHAGQRTQQLPPLVTKSRSGPQPVVDRDSVFVDHHRQLFASRRSLGASARMRPLHSRAATAHALRPLPPGATPAAPDDERGQSASWSVGHALSPAGAAPSAPADAAPPLPASASEPTLAPPLPPSPARSLDDRLGALDEGPDDDFAIPPPVALPGEDGVGVLRSTPSFTSRPSLSRAPSMSPQSASALRPASLRRSVSSHHDLGSIRGSLFEEALRPAQLAGASAALGGSFRASIPRSTSQSSLSDGGTPKPVTPYRVSLVGSGAPSGASGASGAASQRTSPAHAPDRGGPLAPLGAPDEPDADESAFGEGDASEHVERFVAILGVTPPFASLSRAELERLCACARYSVHARHHVVFREGAPAPSVGVLLAGVLEVRDHSGRVETYERRVQQSTAAPLFGLEGCGFTPRLATARAASDGCALMLIPAEALPQAARAGCRRLVVVELLKRTRELEAALLRSAAARASLAPLFHPLRLRAGQPLCAQGEPSDALYVLVAGSLDVRVKGAHAGEVLVATLEPRHDGHAPMLGETVLEGGGARSASVSAREPSWLLRMDAEHAPKLCAAVPQLLDSLATARKLHDFTDRTKVHAADRKHMERALTSAMLGAMHGARRSGGAGAAPAPPAEGLAEREGREAPPREPDESASGLGAQLASAMERRPSRDANAALTQQASAFFERGEREGEGRAGEAEAAQLAAHSLGPGAHLAGPSFSRPASSLEAGASFSVSTGKVRHSMSMRLEGADGPLWRQPQLLTGWGAKGATAAPRPEEPPPVVDRRSVLAQVRVLARQSMARPTGS